MSPQQFSVLIVGDELALLRLLRRSLTDNGFTVEEVRTVGQVSKSIQQRPVDLLIVDINEMSRDAALALCRRVRDLGQKVGILLIIERYFEKNIVQVLESGADDYITKPLRISELIGRCHVVLRHIPDSSAEEETSICPGDLELDLGRRQLRKAGKVVHLTPTEFNLLTLLMKNRGVALDHGKLLRTIWGPEYGGELEYLRAYIRLLRKKIETDPAQPKYLLTEPWLGYRFCIPSCSERVSADPR